MTQSHISVVFFDLGDTLVTGNRGWVPGALEALESLSGVGIRLGIISNTGDLTRSALADLLPVDFRFSSFEEELIVLSSEVGIEKPKAQIFGLAIDRAGVSPLEIVFCGEKLSETLAAQMAGMLAARVSVRVEEGNVVASDIARWAEQMIELI